MHANAPSPDNPQQPTPSPHPRLVLGSTSPYRRELLTRWGLPFETCAPRVDETPLAGERPQDLAWRLARLKAEDVVQQEAQMTTQARATPAGRAAAQSLQADDDVIVIGSDQVADLNGQPLGKPGTHERAVAQLQAMRGQTVLFHTAVCVARPRTGFIQTQVHTVQVQFRDLSDADIEVYLQLEQPYDCAGSAKAECLGIVLLARIESDDPTTLIGLPLIATAALMREAGADPLRWRASLLQGPALSPALSPAISPAISP